MYHNGGHPICMPPSTCKCKWNTLCPPCWPQLITAVGVCVCMCVCVCEQEGGEREACIQWGSLCRALNTMYHVMLACGSACPVCLENAQLS